MAGLNMEIFFAVLRWVHVLAGAFGLVLFWVPIFSRKGSQLHKQFGRGFIWCVNIIGVSALVSVSLRLGMMAINGQAFSQQPMAGFLVFLGYLGLNVLISAWYMRHVVINQRDLAGLGRPLAWLGVALCGASSVGLLATAVLLPSKASMVMYMLSPVGILNMWSMRRHLRAPMREPKAWFYEHMGQGIGLGIAFHTAFFVFGAQSVFSQWLSGFWGVLPWIAPVAIGVTANVLWERAYRRRFAGVQRHAAIQAVPT